MAWHIRIQVLTGYVVEDPELFGPEAEQFSHRRLVASWIFFTLDVCSEQSVG
jgi:hypothetical protein